MVLGQQIYEGTGRQTAIRVLGGGKMEVSEQLIGRFMGNDGIEFSTVTNEPRPDGSLFGEVNGVFSTKDGQSVTFKGQGIGWFKPGGAISFRAAVYYWTASEKLAAANKVVGVCEVEIDMNGNVVIKAWEWK